MAVTILIIAAAVGIGIFFGARQAKQTKALLADGKMIRRDMHFAEKGEEFTARIGTPQDLRTALESRPFPCSVNGSTRSAVTFTGSTFAARLLQTAFDAASGIGVYRFEFTRFKQRNGMYEESNAMNLLMTSVEKAFLQLDPNTGVKPYALDLRTKHTIF